MIIDAKDLIVGRIATVAAKKALMGEEIIIVNCEQAVLTGNRKFLIAHYQNKAKRGAPLFGPYYPKRADLIVRRIIRGMLPYKQDRGRTAYKRVMCYLGIPHELSQQKLETIEEANVKKLITRKYLTIGEISKQVGAKQ